MRRGKENGLSRHMSEGVAMVATWPVYLDRRPNDPEPVVHKPDMVRVEG